MNPQAFAARIRAHTLRMVARSRASHVGSCLSIADILAVLYTRTLRVDPARPGWLERDRFILSKGHAAAVLYAALAERGFFPAEWLERYCEPGAPLGGHVTSHGVPGVELSTGSLGHGLPVACGMALAAKRGQLRWRSYVLVGDGELDEGSNWEALLFAAHHRLDNLVLLIDHNKLQSFGSVSEVLDLGSLADKIRAFGWTVEEIDGHDLDAIERATTRAEPGAPRAVLAHTVKGKGVSFMENQLAWHYRSPNPEQLEQALREVGA